MEDFYEIRVKGHLGSQWQDWFEGLSMQNYENGEMALQGPIRDQAALYGTLIKIRNLGLSLLAVNRIQAQMYKQ